MAKGRQELEERFDRLENAIWQLTRSIERLEDIIAGEQAPPRQAPDAPAPAPVEPRPSELRPSERHAQEAPPIKPQAPPPPIQPEPKAPSLLLETLRDSNFWLNKIGIVLLLLGVAFLFRYSADQGWLTPPMRVAFGLVIGVGLLATGTHIHGKSRHFSQVLSGGGIAALYITGFGAYELYELVPYGVAFFFMGTVSLIAFLLSLKQQEMTLSLIGVAGALATPLFLERGIDTLPGVVAYTGTVLAVAAGIYLYKGWRTLLEVSVAGGWISLLVYLSTLPVNKELAANDRIALQAGVGAALAAFWLVPVIREVLRARQPGKWEYHTPAWMRALHPRDRRVDISHVYILVISTPLAALRFSMAIWDLSDPAWGWFTLGGAAVFALVFLTLRQWEASRDVAYVHILMAMALLSIALVLLLDGDALFFSLVAQAAVMHAAAYRFHDLRISLISHGYFVLIGLWLAQRLIEADVEGTAILNQQALADLSAIAAAAGVSFLLKEKEVRLVYRLLAHAAFLGWLLRELSSLENGQGYVTVAWGGYAIALLIAGLVLDDGFARLTGLTTLYIVVGKLLLIDLTEVATIWRILLFIGFGLMFLLLSYFYQSLWKPKLSGKIQSGPTAS